LEPGIVPEIGAKHGKSRVPRRNNDLNEITHGKKRKLVGGLTQKHMDF
jgi:hypothetical protein